MIVVESDCCDCDLPCIGSSCKHFKTVRFVCDDCEEDVDDLYYFDGQELCIDCIEHKLERVEYYD